MGFYNDEKTALQYIDMDILKKEFHVTGSDTSRFFLERYGKANPEADLIHADAVSIDTQLSFDCIYSNKVLHHLPPEELAKSLGRQKEILSGNGLIMHSFRRGTGVEEHHGLKFVNQTRTSLRSIVSQVFNIVEVVVYTEMENNDSLYVLARV
jgi:trans-aconitate methyltransferase